MRLLITSNDFDFGTDVSEAVTVESLPRILREIADMLEAPTVPDPDLF